MARRGSGVWLKLFIVALLGLVFYNTWQIHSLKAEIIGLKSQAADRDVARVRDEETSPSPTMLGRARDHADRAKKFLLKGDTKRAGTELEKSLLLMKEAGVDAAAPSRQTIEDMQRTVRDSLETLSRLRRSWRKESDKSKGG